MLSLGEGRQAWGAMTAMVPGRFSFLGGHLDAPQCALCFKTGGLAGVSGRSLRNGHPLSQEGAEGGVEQVST